MNKRKYFIGTSGENINIIKQYSSFEKDIDVIQIHGHRNIYEYPVDKFKKSFNLNSAVEFGEPLRIMKISKKGYEFFHYENELCKGRINPWKQENKIVHKNNYNKEYKQTTKSL